MTAPRRPRIVFLGGAGHHYLRRALASPEDALFVPDPDAPGVAKATAERGGFPLHDGDLASAIARHRPDAVSIGSVYGKAGEHAAVSLRLGLPTVTDKPAAATWEQLATIRSIGGRLVTEFDWRADPALRAARRAVRDGVIGPVILAVAQKTYPLGSRPAWYADRRLYGGTMLWVASHAIDALGFVCGPLHPLSARHGNAATPALGGDGDGGDGDGGGGGEDHATATFALVHGGTAIAHADLARPTGHGTHGDDRLVLRGRDGELVVRNGTCTLTTDAAPQPLPLPDTPPSHEMLLDAVLGGGDDTFGTAATLETADLLLRTRDLADAGRPTPRAAVRE